MQDKQKNNLKIWLSTLTPIIQCSSEVLELCLHVSPYACAYRQCEHVFDCPYAFVFLTSVNQALLLLNCYKIILYAVVQFYPRYNLVFSFALVYGNMIVNIK